MYVIKNDSIIPVACKSVIKLGAVEDNQMQQLEILVSNHFNVSVHDLDCFYNDSPAKLMLCFLAHDILNYSTGSLANKYRINSVFLQNKVQGLYVKALNEKVFFSEVNSLRNAFFNKHICSDKTNINN